MENLMDSYIQEESDILKEYFDLNDVLALQAIHDVQIIRGEDYNYGCYIDGLCYSTALTPIFALWHGIKVFNAKQSKQ